MRKTDQNILKRGREVLAIEREALQRLEGQLDNEFTKAIQLLIRCKGRVILTGIGKSGIIAQKITATLNSTGTPAFYLHPIDALHGDLGMIQKGDVVIIFSKSGDTPELSQLLPALEKLELKILAITGNKKSRLAHVASVVLDCSVEREACPFDLAPTASTTAMLALGDALAVVLYERKGFTAEDFAATHPGGQIGKRLLLQAEDMMKKGKEIPTVGKAASFNDVVLEMSNKRLGATLVVTAGGKLLGIITDGDLRRLLERKADIYGMTAEQMMTPDPMTGRPTLLCSAALVILEENKRMQLPIVDGHGKLLGIIHLHDLIEAGIKS